MHVTLWKHQKWGKLVHKSVCRYQFFVRLRILENRQRNIKSGDQWKIWLFSPLVILFYKIVSKNILDRFSMPKIHIFAFTDEFKTEKLIVFEKKWKFFRNDDFLEKNSRKLPPRGRYSLHLLAQLLRRIRKPILELFFENKIQFKKN